MNQSKARVPDSARIADILKAAENAHFRSLKLEGAEEVGMFEAILAAAPTLEMELRSLDVKVDQPARIDPAPIERALSRLRGLSYLVLANCGLTKLPEFIPRWSELDFLNLQSNSLSELPDSFAHLQNLRILDLQGNRFTRFPEVLTKVTRLSSLNLGDNRLDPLPESIGELAKLSHLSLYRTGLADLPSTISRLQGLHGLHLWNNRFASIPPAIYDLLSLERLDFRNDSTNATQRDDNKITHISPRILQLENLKELKMEGNPVQDPPMEVVAKGADAVRNYFRQLEAGGKDYLYEAKLLILGEGGAGKTTLAGKVVDPNCKLRDDDSTKGIEVTHWSFPLQGGETFRVNVWDFGGQEIYHATHQFFLTKRSLYVLVADNRKEDTDFNYWLNVVSLLSEGSPLLIVKNEKLDRQREINEYGLRAQFPNVRAIMATNLATNRGVAAMRMEIMSSIRNLPHIGTALPITWVKVREKLESDTRNFITVEEYLEICSANGFATREDKLQLSGYLHDLGVCLHFQEDPVLSKVVILKPRWGTDAVYKVLDNKEVINSGGRFASTDLERIWKDEKYSRMQSELLQLMINFKLCYKIPGQSRYIAPQLLPANPLNYKWDGTANLVVRYTYEFMPAGMLTQLIVAMHEFISSQKFVWKSGVLIEKDGAIAEVLEDYSGRQVTVKVARKNRAELLNIVCYELDRIHRTYKGLRFQKLIPCNCQQCGKAALPNAYPLESLRKFVEDGQALIQCHTSYEMVEVARLLTDVNLSKEKLLGEKSQVIFNAPIQDLTVQITESGANVMKKEKQQERGEVEVKSAWANGSFYLFAFAVVVAGLGVLARSIPVYVLPLVLIAALLFVPLIGVLQLKQDARLGEKPFLEILKLVIRQLPLLRNKPQVDQEGHADEPPDNPRKQ
jgi:internalin A